MDTDAIRDDLKMIIDNLLARENLSAMSRFVRAVRACLFFRNTNTYPVMDSVYSEVIKPYLSILTRPALLKSKNGFKAVAEFLELERACWAYTNTRESQQHFKSVMGFVSALGQNAGAVFGEYHHGKIHLSKQKRRRSLSFCSAPAYSLIPMCF